MQSKRKDDTDRFMRAIAAFSAAPEKTTSLGRLLQKDVDSPVQAILAEINETVLRRSLLFRTADGRELMLDVAERRLQEVSVLPDGATAQFQALCGKSLGDPDSGAVIDLLIAFVGPAEEITVLSKLPEFPSEGDFAGLSARHLLVQLAAQSAAALPTGVSDLVEACKPVAHAIWIDHGGVSPFCWGDAEGCARFESLSRSSLSQGHDRGSVMLWSGGLREQCAVLRARREDLDIFVLCHEADAQVCFRQLQGCVAI